MEIDLLKIIDMPIKKKLDFLRMANIFGLVPKDKEQEFDRYVRENTVTVENTKNVPIQGGSDGLIKIIKSEFPYTFQVKLPDYLRSCDFQTLVSGKIEPFIREQQISSTNHIVFSGGGHLYVCFKDKADAVLAKLYFGEGKLLCDIAEEEGFGRADGT